MVILDMVLCHLTGQFLFQYMDFTEFLNTPGCAKGKHTNEKPEEPEHITGQIGESNDIELPQVSNVTSTPRESIESRIHLPRPDFAKAPLIR